MSSDFLIPFGLHKESGELVDVGSVKKGKNCGCICPSCQTPLIARQGEEKEWHFAHKSTKNEDKTKEPCSYSFAVSLRLMIKQLSVHGIELSLPEMISIYTVQDIASGKTFDVPYPVTKPSTIRLESVDIEQRVDDCLVDVISQVSGCTFVIYVTYKGRKIPYSLKESLTPNLAVIELQAAFLFEAFKEVTAGKYTEALSKFLSESSSGFKWVIHPRQSKALYTLQNHISENFDYYLEKYSLSNQYNHENNFSTLNNSITKEQLHHNCRICEKSWYGESPYCSNCKTHLYTF